MDNYSDINILMMFDKRVLAAYIVSVGGALGNENVSARVKRFEIELEANKIISEMKRLRGIMILNDVNSDRYRAILDKFDKLSEKVKPIVEQMEELDERT